VHHDRYLRIPVFSIFFFSSAVIFAPGLRLGIPAFIMQQMELAAGGRISHMMSDEYLVGSINGCY
ncbi:MAG: hypothetical protein IKL25_00120, partial [Clostridia bacterium]|nr:hypothetical protein [Clostridia bacterium]